MLLYGIHNQTNKNMKKKFISVMLALLCATSLGSAKDETYVYQHGHASWYSVSTNGGTKSASGKKLNNLAATAAHKTVPMGAKVRVMNVKNGKSEIVIIDDRGPYIKGRIIDVTIGCAERLGFKQQGIAQVKLEVVKN